METNNQANKSARGNGLRGLLVCVLCIASFAASVFLLKEMKRLGYGAVISSDCHDARALSCHYEESAELLRSCGFRELYILDEPGVFRPVSL